MNKIQQLEMRVFLSHPQSLTWHRSLDPHIAEKGKSCLTCQAVQSRRGIGFLLTRTWIRAGTVELKSTSTGAK